MNKIAVLGSRAEYVNFVALVEFKAEYHHITHILDLQGKEFIGVVTLPKWRESYGAPELFLQTVEFQVKKHL